MNIKSFMLLVITIIVTSLVSGCEKANNTMIVKDLCDNGYEYGLYYEDAYKLFTQNDHTNAILKLEKAISLYDGENQDLNEIYLLLGDIHYSQKEYKKAIDSFNKAIEVERSYNKNESDIFITYLKLGNCYTSIGNLNKAVQMYILADNEYQLSNYKYGYDETYILDEICTICYLMKDYTNSIKYAELIIHYPHNQLVDKSTYKKVLLHTYANLVSIYYYTDQYQNLITTSKVGRELAISQDNYVLAIGMTYCEGYGYENIGLNSNAKESIEEGIDLCNSVLSKGYNEKVSSDLDILKKYLVKLDQ